MMKRRSKKFDFLKLSICCAKKLSDNMNSNGLLAQLVKASDYDFRVNQEIPGSSPGWVIPFFALFWDLSIAGGSAVNAYVDGCFFFLL